jgi:hypothetical protein
MQFKGGVYEVEMPAAPPAPLPGSRIAFSKNGKMQVNVSKCFKMFQNVSKGFKRFQTVSKGFKRFQKVSKCFKLNFKTLQNVSKIFQNVSKCFKMFRNVSKRFEMFQNVSKMFQGAAFADVTAGTYFPAASLYTQPNPTRLAEVRFNFGPSFVHPPVSLLNVP